MKSDFYKHPSEGFAVGDTVRIHNPKRRFGPPDIITKVVLVTDRYVDTADGMRWSTKTHRAWGGDFVCGRPLLVPVRERDFAEVERQKMIYEATLAVRQLADRQFEISKVTGLDLTLFHAHVTTAAQTIVNSKAEVKAS